jgi:hypothetical protein
MKTNIKNNILRNKTFVGVLFCLLWGTIQASEPLWTIVPAPGSNPSQTIPQNATATVLYIVQNQSRKPKTLVMQSIPGITQTTPCPLLPKGQAGSSCTFNLSVTGSALPQAGIHGGPIICQANPDGSPNSNQCYRPSSANNLNITPGLSAGATITVDPSTLYFLSGNTGLVTITNSVTSLQSANNVAATIPVGSNISVQSTTCGAALAIGASCTITFTASAAEGPIAIPIAGENTNTVHVDVTVLNQLLISITNPVQQNRVVIVSSMTPLLLEITNDVGSTMNANAITVSDKTACPNLSVDDSDCISLAPGAACTLALTSNTPYAPCMITISGSNTTNSPTTLIAFSYLGGLVFQESGGNGKIVIDVAQGFESTWTDTPSNIAGATSLDDGVSNTNSIVADTACSDYTPGCAAQGCRNIGAVWYLPASNELSAVYNALCSNTTIPCNFGEFSSSEYWSSSQFDSMLAATIEFPLGTPHLTGKELFELPIRCIRNFP